MTGNADAVPIEPATGFAITPCIICGDAMRKHWSSNGHCYFACPRCQFVRVAPVPPIEALKDYYEKDYEVARDGYQRNIREHGPRDLGTLERINGLGRMLEVGSSWGFFLDIARLRGWDVRGVELSESAAKWAHQKLGLNVTCGTIEDFPFLQHGAFDVVVAWHVIEHVPDPIHFLSIMHDNLGPGGILALRTPNIRSVPARLNGRVWQWVEAPAHISLFSLKSLGIAVERAGFSVRLIATRRGDAYNPVFELLRGCALRSGLHLHIKELFKLRDANGVSSSPESKTSKGGKRARILGQLNRLFDIGFFFLYPIEKLFEFAGWGPELFLIAERKDSQPVAKRSV
jgi:SAM-dependent methyltransferase